MRGVETIAGGCKRLLLPLLLALLVAGCAADPAGAACTLEKVASAPVQEVGGLPVVDARIAEQTVRLLVDTGSVRSLLSPVAAARLDVRRDPWVSDHIIGVGGTGSSYWNAITRSVTIGGVPLIEPEMAVAPLEVPVDGLLGADFWRRFDVDLDLPGKRITLYRASPCRRVIAPWMGAAVLIDGVPGPRDRLLLPATLDGVKATAVFDTGAQGSAVTLRLAAKLKPPVGGWQVAKLYGINGGFTAVPARRFAQVAVGGLAFSDEELPLLPLLPGPADMLVGEDLLRGCRTWFSFQARQVFVATDPGNVLPCAEGK